MNAILTVFFGTTHDNARERAIDTFAEEIRSRYPNYKVYTAFSSNTVIKKLHSRGIIYLTVSEALEAVLKDGVCNVYIQPMLFIEGMEYDKLIRTAMKFKEKFSLMKFGKPLLSDEEDYEKAANAVFGIFESYDYDALILMGHGTEHSANISYQKINEVFCRLDKKNIYVGTVEAMPAIKNITEFLSNKYKKILLTPFMLVSGDHAVNDMAGEGGWSEQLEIKGYLVNTIIKGMGEYAKIREIFFEHIDSLTAPF